MTVSRRRVLPALAGAGLAGAGLAGSGSAHAAGPAPGGLALVVLDVGGTLIADRGEVPRSMLGALSRHGVPVTAQELSSWRGASKRAMIQHFVRRAGKSASLVDAVHADFNAAAMRAYEKVAPIAGAEAAMRAMQAMGLKLATTTGFDRPLYDAIVRRLNWAHYFAASVTSDEVREGRPAPYLLFRAMERAGIGDVRQVSAVGDTPLDLQAAHNAAILAWGVFSGAATEERLRKEPSAGVLPSVAALPAVLRKGAYRSICR